MDLEWDSVWRAKCKEFLKKTKDFGAHWCWWTGRVRRKWTQNGIQYGEQNVRNSEGKLRILELIGAGGQDEFAENGLRMGFSMESKM